MNKLPIFLVSLTAFVGVAVANVGTQSGPPPRFAVIVVYNQNAAFEDFRRDYRPEAREAAAPEAWGYVDRGVLARTQALEHAHGFQASHVYSHALRGFSATLTARQMVDVENDPTVAYIEADGPMAATAQTTPWGIDRIDADLSTTLAGNGSGTVTGVNVYVIDTGVASHTDLNVVRNVNFAGGQPTDCNGHGTHVAGTIAARDNASDVVGVAPGAPVTGVKVLGCSGSGTTSGVIKGVDWVSANAVAPAVANMSLGGGASAALDAAVLASVSRGVFYSIAAGNSGADACSSSPARVGGANAGVVTTAATDSGDKEASWSNYGTCVDVWAPGVNILSTRRGGGTTTMSGTSMASPHVGGAGALYRSKNPGATPAAVEYAIKSLLVVPGPSSKNGSLLQLLNVAAF